MSECLALTVDAWRGRVCTSNLPAAVRHVCLTLAAPLSLGGTQVTTSYERLSRETGYGRNDVQGYLEAAEAAGWIDLRVVGEVSGQPRAFALSICWPPGNDGVAG